MGPKIAFILRVLTSCVRLRVPLIHRPTNQSSDADARCCLERGCSGASPQRVRLALRSSLVLGDARRELFDDLLTATAC
ncbi:MAG TPA: hypothetical protein VI434_04265 [Candidatus Dormibacteraeota bacterium]